MTEIFDGSQETTKTRAKRTESEAESTAAHSHRKHRHVDEYSSVMRQASPAASHFDAFVPKPENIFFDSQLEDEKVLLMLRRHPVTQVPWVLATIVLIFLPLLFSYVPLLDFLPATYHVAALIGWYLLVVGFVLESFLTWFFNVFIITDERIVDVDFYSLLYKNISSAKIDNVEDITSVTGGALGSIFNYGTVKIQTAAAVGEFEFEDVPQPDRVVAFLNELLVEEEQEKLEGRSR